jgi:phage recombination protein Bet
VTDLEVIPPGELYPKPPQLSIAQIETVRNFLAPKLTDDELALFVSICNRSGLDPFGHQIWAYKRSDKLVIQASIDGLRLIALRTGLYGGQRPAKWCGLDRVWTDVWLGPDHPAAAMAAVFRKDYPEPTTAVAVWDSYAAKDNNGQPMNVWKTAGDVMLAKCAEALALRKAFPAETAGLYVAGEIPTDEATPVVAAGPPDPRIPRDEAAFLTAAINGLSKQAVDWLDGTVAADPLQIPNINGPNFRRSHRDRLAWHIVVAQRIKPADPETGEIGDDPEAA